jgi:hypothetical protein
MKGVHLVLHVAWIGDTRNAHNFYICLFMAERMGG